MRVGDFRSRVAAVLASPSHTWALPSLIFLLIALGSLGPSSFFLHLDSPTEDMMAIDLLRGCHGTGGTKPLIRFLLAAVYAVGGAHPLWEPAILTLLGLVTAAAVYQLMHSLTRSRRWALAGAVWFMTLPTILYYTRMHIGYPLALFTLAGLLYSRERYGWAGLAFGLTLTAHVSYLLPICAWLGLALLLGERPRRPAVLARLAAGMLLPWLLAEMAYFLYDGKVLGWSRSIRADIIRISSAYKGGTWLDGWRVLVFANGPLNALLLVAGLLYPFARKPRVRLMDVVYLAGWSVVGFHVVNAGTMGVAFRHRMISGAYPLLAIVSTFTLMRLSRRVAERLATFGRVARRVWRLAGVTLVALALPAAIIDQTLDATAGSRTAYDVANRVMAEAAEAGLPVRYYGNLHSSRYLASLNHVEMVHNETSLDIISADTRAVFIFEAADHPMLIAIHADPRIDPTLYAITSYPHFTAYRPRVVEDSITLADLRRLGNLTYAHAPDADHSELVVWWPEHPSGTFQARHVVYRDTQHLMTLHYPGSGCITPKMFEDGTKNYYDILLAKAALIWKAVAAGDLAEARAVIEAALADRQIGDLSLGRGDE